MRRTKAETKAIVDRAKFLKELLAEFGFILSGFDPGVQAIHIASMRGNTYGSQHTLNLDGRQWFFIEPLLVELRQLRKEKKK